MPFGLSATSTYLFASVQLDKRISCCPARRRQAQKMLQNFHVSKVSRRSAEDKRKIGSTCCARSLHCTSETAACSKWQSRLTDPSVTLRSAILGSYGSPGGLKAAAEACRFRAPQQELASTRGREPRPRWLLVSAPRVSGSEQGVGLLSTI